MDPEWEEVLALLRWRRQRYYGSLGLFLLVVLVASLLGRVLEMEAVVLGVFGGVVYLYQMGVERRFQKGIKEIELKYNWIIVNHIIETTRSP